MAESSAAAGDGSSPIELESRLVELLYEAAAEGLSNEALVALTPNVDPKQRGVAINRLLSVGRVEMRKAAAGGADFVLRLKSEQSVERLRGSSAEESLVYGVIEEAANKGIWIRDIRARSGLSQAQLNKVLRSLEHRKLVKAVKALGASRKKLFMLFELEPDVSLTGGAFHTDQEFDTQFVDMLNEQCLSFLRARRQAARERHAALLAQDSASLLSVDQVWQHIRDLQISKIELTVKEVERILETLVFDGEAERHADGADGGVRYCAVRAAAVASPLVSVPCTFCPVFADCHPGGVISPATCSYFKDWLDAV